MRVIVKTKNVYYLPSGRIFVVELPEGNLIECTEMRDVSMHGKSHREVREASDPRVVWKHLVPYEDKWLLTVSTQIGCPHQCQFCDVPKVNFVRNLSENEILSQVRLLLHATPYVERCNKAKIGFARMGEPAHNLKNVLWAMRSLPAVADECHRDIKWLPCFNSILPAKTLEGKSGMDVLGEVIEAKELYFDGFMHFQVSCNSTDEDTRRKLFGGASVVPIEDVIKFVNFHKITMRTVTLNFILMDGVEVDAEKLSKMGMTGEKFMVKLIALNRTSRSDEFGIKASANYSNYDEFEKYEAAFKKVGVPVCYDAVARCEEAGLCCGQLAFINQ
jgi:23S rRNA (adenine2503-C2)-methyltransferase